MRKLLSFVSLSSLYVLPFPRTPAFSQPGASAGVFGNVVDSQGGIIAGAKVTLLHIASSVICCVGKRTWPSMMRSRT